MLNRIKFMKVNQHKRFDYRPLYYNERKEQLLKQVEKHKEKSININKREFELREQFSRNKYYDSIQHQSKKSTIRLIIILIIILGLVFYLFQGLSDISEVIKQSK